VAAGGLAVVEKAITVEALAGMTELLDRPFLFAIQHAPSGACFFLGRVSDPAGK
jgi:serine protease inhibitor